MALRLDGVEWALGDFRLRAELSIERGALVAVMGPSGGGKSTLLSGIAGFLLPATGRIAWEGRDLGPLPPAERPVSMLFQDNNLFPHLTAAQNAGLALRPSLRLTVPEKAQVETALERVGLGGLGGRKPSELSGGQQGRAALARLLLSDRPILLMDEPFAALGPALRAEMLALTREVVMAKGLTLMMVTHDPADAVAIADQVIVVAGGRASPPAPTAALLANPPPELAEYLGR